MASRTRRQNRYDGIGNRRFGPSHARMGIDVEGRIHHVAYDADRIYVIDGTEVVTVADLDDRPCWHWAAYVDRECGWDSIDMIFLDVDFDDLAATLDGDA